MEKAGKNLVPLNDGYLLARTRTVVSEMRTPIILVRTGYVTRIRVGEYSPSEVLGRRMGGSWMSGQQFCEKAEWRKLYDDDGK